MKGIERTILMRLILLVFACFFALSASGCMGRDNSNESSSPRSENQQVRVQQTIPPKTEIKNDEKVSARLEKLAESVPNVNNATCVVIGNTAIVGIDVKGDLDRARVGTIKYSVAEALRKDPDGLYAIVTADLDIGNRLQEMRQDIASGHPISGFAEELADIIGRIIPQLPRDITPANDEQSPSNQGQPNDPNAGTGQ
jgi:YhcN/YlaJ family sporulation lipoprotein